MPAGVDVGLHGKTPRIEGDSIRRGKATREELFPTVAETGGKIVLGGLPLLADLLLRDNRLAGHLRRRIGFFSSTIVSVATWPCSQAFRRERISRLWLAGTAREPVAAASHSCSASLSRWRGGSRLS